MMYQLFIPFQKCNKNSLPWCWLSNLFFAATETRGNTNFPYDFSFPVMTQGHRGIIDDYRIISYDNKLCKNCGITHCTGVIYYNNNNFIIQATAVPMRLFHLVNRLLYQLFLLFLKIINTAYNDIGYVTLFFTAIETRGRTIFLMTSVFPLWLKDIGA